MAGMSYTPPSCVDAATVQGRVQVPTPLVSRGARVTASPGVLHPSEATDGRYHDVDSVVFGLPTADEPQWVAIELEGSYERLLLTWADSSFDPYTTLTFAPRSYVVEVSADSTDGEDGHFEEVVKVEDNPVRTREHAFDFGGMKWVRFSVTGAPEDSATVALDEIALYDLGTLDSETPPDTWFFLGDSITQGAFSRNHNDYDFDAVVSASATAYTPAYLNGGIGSELAKDGLARLDQAIELNPDMKHFVVGYGTNDSWGSQSVSGVGFEDTMNEIVSRLLAADKVPILARIPYASKSHSTLPAFNEVIDRITLEQELPCGADLYGWFLMNPDQLSDDGVHPTTQGYARMNEQWGKAVLPLYEPSDE
jgi:acyl-CoA thioesterase-1